ncbi:hypothetical protein CRENBAI_020400 [Crenichthys baileyi]|uniref:Unique cartilage matrix-associated protein n=1 Tax=Crenichthys baileyi TaxID=28760 RepID=A0AAV9SHB4_9TELE
MSWTRAFTLTVLSILLIIAFSSVVKSAVVQDDSKPADAQGAARQVFMADSEASNFFKRRSRRSPKYYAELQEAEIACGSGFTSLWLDWDDDIVFFEFELSKFRSITDALVVVLLDTTPKCEFYGISHKQEAAEGVTGYRGASPASSAEQRMKRAASERRREYNEEQRDEYENYVEEDRNEINERTRVMSEQLREYHYDGLYPRLRWFH